VSARAEAIEAPKLRFGWLWWGVGWLLVLATINASLQPSVWIGEVVTNDKVLHFLGYTALALWFGGVARRGQYMIVGSLLIALGGALEIGQGVMHMGRNADWFDFLANSLGIVTGLTISALGVGNWMVWIERLLRPKS
jgi:hypothetical protein